MAIFITVRHGENISNIFNPDCYIVNFIACIRKKCGIQEDMIVDLTDEQGLLIDVLSRHGFDRASNYVSPFGTYILVEKVPVNLGMSRVVRGLPSVPDTLFEAEVKERKTKNIRIIKTDFQYQYVPLLKCISDEYPEYSIHVDVENKPTMRKKDASTGRRWSGASATSRQQRRPLASNSGRRTSRSNSRRPLK
ncbi:uncharacterized protein LOC144422094 [Styela clava]